MSEEATPEVTENIESERLINPEVQTENESVDALDGAPVMVDSEAPITTDPAEVEPETRPDWCSEKFWNDEKCEVEIENLHKSYDEIQKKMSAGKHKAPADGKYDLSSAQNISEEDPMLEGFLEIAKSEGFSQDQVDQILGLVAAGQEDLEQNIVDERAKLGRNADQILESLNSWISKFGSSGVLTTNEVNSLADSMDNAEVILALNKIRRSYGEQNIPSASQTLDTQPQNMNDIQSLMRDPKYGVDAAYTESVERKVYEMNGEPYAPSY